MATDDNDNDGWGALNYPGVPADEKFERLSQFRHDVCGILGIDAENVTDTEILEVLDRVRSIWAASVAVVKTMYGQFQQTEAVRHEMRKIMSRIEGEYEGRKEWKVHRSHALGGKYDKALRARSVETLKFVAVQDIDETRKVWCHAVDGGDHVLGPPAGIEIHEYSDLAYAKDACIRKLIEHLDIINDGLS